MLTAMAFIGSLVLLTIVFVGSYKIYEYIMRKNSSTTKKRKI